MQSNGKAGVDYTKYNCAKHAGKMTKFNYKEFDGNIKATFMKHK
jgi:hypothetical protein